MAAIIPISYLHCNTCNKQVSTGFFAVPTQTPDRGIIIRAYIECPECIEKKMEQPIAVDDKFVLNSYGRKCFDLGFIAGKKETDEN